MVARYLCLTTSTRCPPLTNQPNVCNSMLIHSHVTHEAWATFTQLFNMFKQAYLTQFHLVHVYDEDDVWSHSINEESKATILSPPHNTKTSIKPICSPTSEDVANSPIPPSTLATTSIPFTLPSLRYVNSVENQTQPKYSVWTHYFVALTICHRIIVNERTGWPYINHPPPTL